MPAFFMGKNSMTRPRKTAPDPWGAIETTTLDNGQAVAIWENATTGERRVVPQGVHPAQQPLAEVIRIEPDQEEIEETATDRVASILRRAHDSGGGQLRVYKVDKGSLVWCETYTPEQFEAGDLPMLRDTFGPGDYELRLYGPHPVTSKYGVIAKTRVVIAQALKTAPDRREDSGLAQVLATIAEGQRAMLQALTERPQAKDPTEEMSKMLGLMVTMRQAMGIDAQPRSQITEIVQAIRELREASDEINPDKEDNQSLLGALPQVLDVVKQGMAQQSQPQALPLVELPASMASAPVMQQPPQPPQPPTNPETQEENAVFNPLVILQLKAYLKTLINMAETNQPIEKCAAFVYDKMPDEIVELMSLDNWFDLLLEVAPEVGKHEAWFVQVRNAALGMFDPFDDEGDDKAA
jgi:hypothetical protein